MVRNKRIAFGLLLLFGGVLFSGSAPYFGGIAKDNIKIYRGTIEDAADFITRFPTAEEAQETFDRLNGIVDNFRLVLAGESPIDLVDIQEKCSFVLETHRKTEVLEWCLLGLCLDGEISLLSGEGIELTLPSYCLDAGKAGPSEDEFFSIERISGKQSEWLTPLLDYVSRHPDKDLPVQELVWNMGKKVPYEDLPENQQALLSSIVPNAEKQYGKKLGTKLLGRVVDEVKSRVDIISDFESTADEINRRKSRLELVLPKYDTFRMDNGLLVKIRSTGSFKEITLVIVNPRESAGRDGERGRMNLGLGYGIEHGMVLSNLAPYVWTPSNSATAAGQGKWGKTKNWWKENNGKIESWSNRAGDVKDIINSYNEGGLKGVSDYAKGRGFDESLDVFKSLVKGNPEAERAFELFRSFNKDLLKADNDKQNRGNKEKMKFFRPRNYRFKPGRRDVQPLAASGGF
jgi:hypothetical protein